MKKISITLLSIVFVSFFVSCKKDNSISTNNGAAALGAKHLASLTSTDNWQVLPGTGTDIGIGANGSVFITGDSVVSTTGGFAILKWNGTSWSTFGGAAVRLSVDSLGDPWVVNKSHLIYQYNGSAFHVLPGTATDIGVGGHNTVFITDTTTSTDGFRVSKWNGTSWVVQSGISGVRVAVDPTGAPWVVTKSNLIYKNIAGTWTLMPGTATDIGIGANGTIYIVSTTFSSLTGGDQISKWNGTGWTATVSGAGVNISVDPQGHPWTVNASHLIYNNLNL
jgi:hypothetical protein